MPTDETEKRRRSTKERRSKSSSSRTRDRHHEPSKSQESTATKPPSTLDDLRRARVDYLTAPQDEHRRRMKYEYVKTVKVKGAVKAESAKEGSTVSSARSNAETRSRSTRTKSKRRSEAAAAAAAPAPAEDDDSDGQYVYRTARAKHPVPGAYDAERNERQGQDDRKSSRTRSTKVTRSRTERRHTEPIIRLESAAKENATAVRPPLRKTTTTLSERAHSTRPRATMPGGLEADTATVVSVSTVARKSGGSILGSLFGSRPQPVERRVQCLACGDDVLSTKTAKLPCTHRMCHTCLKRLFKLSVTDPAHMPPRCCTEQAISLKHVDALFDQEFKRAYNRKFKEFSTKNKIYCPVRGCGEWIQPKHVTVDKGRKVGKCPACKAYVCAICSQKMHKTRDCPKDPATKEFAEAAKKAGWQKCYDCSAMVELKEGCNHMTCRCTAEFCMMCGLKWKSCDCPWFSYDQVDVLADPVRAQQEMDRRREQEHRDEAMARRMEALQVEEDDTPGMADWFQLGRAAGQRRPPPTLVRPAREVARETRAGTHTRDQHVRNALANFLEDHHNIVRHDNHRSPAMPGGWDDGPHQFRQLTPPSVRRYQQRDLFDPAAAEEQEEDFSATVADFQETPVVSRRHTQRRRADSGFGPGSVPYFFEGRHMTEEEEDQERQIRAWATNLLHE